MFFIGYRATEEFYPVSTKYRRVGTQMAGREGTKFKICKLILSSSKIYYMKIFKWE